VGDDLPPSGPDGLVSASHPLFQVPQVYYEGLVTLERALREGDRSGIETAEAQLVEALRVEAEEEGMSLERALQLATEGSKSPALHFPYRLVGNLMYLARVREQLGDTSLRDGAVAADVMDPDAYAFHFGTRDVDEVIRFELLDACFNLGLHVRSIVDRWAAEHDGLTPERLEDLVPEYLAYVPRCPVSGASFDELYRRLDGGRDYQIVCDSHQSINGGPVCVGPRCRQAVNPALEQTFKIYPMLLGSFLDKGRRDLFLPLLLERAPLARGQVVADVGAGAGMFSIPFAQAVGPEGKVYSVDINASVLAFVAARAESHEDTRVETVLSVRPDVTLPEASVDTTFIIQTYHAMLDLDRPESPDVWRDKTGPWMRTVHRAIKPGGTLVIQDGSDKMDPDVVVANLATIGFENTALDLGWDRQYIAVFRRVDAPEP